MVKRALLDELKMSLVVIDTIGDETMIDLNQVALNLKKNVKIGPLLPIKDNQDQRVETRKEDLEAVHTKRTIVTVMEVDVIDAIEEEKGTDGEADLQVMVLMTNAIASTVMHLKET